MEVMYIRSQAERKSQADVHASVGGMNKAHRVTRVANAIERVYATNASVLYLAKREERADAQREERRAKRK